MERKFAKSGFGKGAAVLVISGFLCKVLGALFRLPLTNLLGVEGIGMFQIVMALYAFALVITSGGVATSLSKLISSARASGKSQNISRYLSHALCLSVLIGAAIGVLFLCFANLLASFQNLESGINYYLFVFLLPAGGVIAALRGFFQGHENMFPTASSQIIEQVFKFSFGLLFAFFLGKQSVFMGVFGAFLGIVLSEVVAICFLVFLFLKKKNKFDFSKENARSSTFKEFANANFPLAFSSSVLPLTAAFDALVIIPRLIIAGVTGSLASKLFGLQAGVVGAVLNFPLIISMALTTALLPNISFLSSKGNSSSRVVEKSLRTLLLLVLPATFGVVAISKQLLGVIYGNLTAQEMQVSFYLMLYGGFAIVFTALMQYLFMLLQSKGEFKFVLAITLIGGVVKANISFFLAAVPDISIFAIVLGNICLSGIVCILALIRLKKIFAFRLCFFDLLDILLSTVFMFLAVYYFVNSSPLSLVPNLLVGILLGMVTFGVFATPVIYKVLTNKLSKTR